MCWYRAIVGCTPRARAIPNAFSQHGNCNWNLVLPVPYLRAWQDMSLSESPSALGAVSRFAPRMPLLNPISTERSLYLS